MPELNTLYSQLDDLIQSDTPSIREMRRYLHAHPEPSGEETRTTAYIADQLSSLDVEYRTGPDGRGLVVDFPREGADRIIAFRADIDALRLQDEKTVSYRSRENNLMHACGHDAHTAMAFGAVKALSKLKDALPKGYTWRCIFQPAEESATGAREMIAWDALRNVECIIALHVDPVLDAGQIGYRSGSLTACCEEFDILVEGRGGHGARPHTTIDPILAATQIVQSVYTMLPRSSDARDPLVVSFGVIQGGINPNVIPESVCLKFEPDGLLTSPLLTCFFDLVNKNLVVGQRHQDGFHRCLLLRRGRCASRGDESLCLLKQPGCLIDVVQRRIGTGGIILDVTQQVDARRGDARRSQ